eukprot:Em0024g160a
MVPTLVMQNSGTGGVGKATATTTNPVLGLSVALGFLIFLTLVVMIVMTCLFIHMYLKTKAHSRVVPQAGGTFTQLTPPSPLENPATQSEDCAKEENIL